MGNEDFGFIEGVMRKFRFTGSQILAVPAEGGAGVLTVAVSLNRRLRGLAGRFLWTSATG